MKRSPRQVLIGAGAGFAGDRTDAAGPIVAEFLKRDGPRFLIYETLAERTLALSQLEKARDPDRGFNPSLEAFVAPVLSDCLREGIRIVSNFGAANPRAAARQLHGMAKALGFPDVRIGIVEGDDITHTLSAAEFASREVDGGILAGATKIVSANAYLGAFPIAHSLDQGADIVVTGRVADPALVLGPLIHSYGWSETDWDALAAGTLVGHLLECGAQVTGGYFADPGCKDVPDLDEVGYPIAEVDPDGTFVITKPEGTGGRVDCRTVTEQILYEIHDPASYLTPDVVLDITQVELAEIGPDRVRVTGAKGRERPEHLKATVCIEGGMLAEGEISYAGPNAAARARLAIQLVQKRLERRAPELQVRADVVGVVSVLGDSAGTMLADAWTRCAAEPAEVRVRLAAESNRGDRASILLDEVEALYCAGPAGGGGVRRRLTPRYRSASCLIERRLIQPEVSFWEPHE